jgi:Ca2+-binding RTX toxin-like protein
MLDSAFGTLRNAGVLFCLLVLSAACGGDKSKPSADKDAGPDADTSHDADTSPDADAPGMVPDGAPSGAGGDGSLSEPDSGLVDGGPDAGEFIPDPEFEGIPNDAVKFGTAPRGCIEAFNAEPETLVLTLTAEVKAVSLAARDGRLEANGVRCSAIKQPKHVKIVGTAAAETVIIDFSAGEFPASIADIVIDAGAGRDLVAVAATRGSDDVRLGTLSGASLIRVATNQPLVRSTNQETLIVSAGPGDDKIAATGGNDLGAALVFALTAYGGAGFDVLTGGAGADTLHGGEDDDLFRTASTADGSDVYEGGSGIDILSYDNRTVAITITVDNIANDGAANERDNIQNTVEGLVGGPLADTITGGEADNTLVGGPGNDTLNGGGGNDIFLERERQGSDIMNGGPGSDTVDYSDRVANLKVTTCVSAVATCVAGACGCAADDGEAGEKDVLANVENAATGSGDDQLFGSAEDNYFEGGAGNDELRGEAGDDYLYGEEGNDSLFGAEGDDLLDGSGGVDLFDAAGGQGDICVYRSPETTSGCELK